MAKVLFPAECIRHLCLHVCVCARACGCVCVACVCLVPIAYFHTCKTQASGAHKLVSIIPDR